MIFFHVGVMYVCVRVNVCMDAHVEANADIGNHPLWSLHISYQGRISQSNQKYANMASLVSQLAPGMPCFHSVSI